MKAKRRKLTKRERGLLWYAADGKCQMCQKQLPDDWHADHIVPFSKTGQTNIHDMQALCPACNRKKGSMGFRKHQQEMIEICQQILAGAPITRIIASVTPGGGKSGLPVILGHYLIPTMYDKICWVVPRVNLREQGDTSFIDPLFRRLLGHKITIMQSTNDLNPSKNTQGFITTYQAIASNNHTLIQEFERQRYILFLDEPHHLPLGSPFANSLAPLVERAGLVVFASGTLDRHDKRQIAFLPYERDETGLLNVDMNEYNDKRAITYSRSDALRERAIAQLEFTLSDAKAEWINTSGDKMSMESFDDEDTDVKGGLKATLETDYAFELIDKMLEHYKSHKALIYRPAQALIVAPNVAAGRLYHEHVTNAGFNCNRVDYNKSESENSRIIDQFRKGSVDILVTVAMAYEGLDAPNATHEAFLTHYRSKPWAAQAFARVARRPKGKERGFIFAPDDPNLNKIIEDIKKEQLDAAVPFGDPLWEPRDDGSRPESSPRAPIVPLVSELTATRAESEYNSITAEQYAFVAEVKSHAGLAGVPDVQLYEAITHAEKLRSSFFAIERDVSAPLITPTEERRKLLTTINDHTKLIDRYKFNEEWGFTNRLIVRRYGKGRQEMTNEELTRVWQWLQKTYPLNY